jgi:hypothetical protein
MIEIVIDGTNFGGKTPLVARLIERLEETGLSVRTASPYREVEVYSRWDDDPIGAARTITAIMSRHRDAAAGADVFVWDRGWPTCFIATKNPAARAFFRPLPRLTYLLLNTAETTQRKVAKYGIREDAYPWMHRRKLQDEISYETLADLQAGDFRRCFTPTLEDSRFDLELVSGEIMADSLRPHPDP